MNISALLGLIILGATLYNGAFQNWHQAQIFFDPRAFAFVVGGTFAVAFLAYPYAVLSKAVDYVLWGLLFRKKKQYLKVSREIAGARSAYLLNQSYATNDSAHPFFRECVMFLLNKNIKNEALKQVLKNRLEQFKQKYQEDYSVLKSLAKYPIAFGFIGAVCSLVEMLQLGQNDLAHWASALVAVFWGLTLSYFIIWPVADSAHKAVQDDFTLRSLIVDGMMLIREKATDDHFQAYLRGYLSLNDRSDFKVQSSQNSYPFAQVPRVEHEDHEPVDESYDDQPIVEEAPIKKHKHADFSYLDSQQQAQPEQPIQTLPVEENVRDQEVASWYSSSEAAHVAGSDIQPIRHEAPPVHIPYDARPPRAADDVAKAAASMTSKEPSGYVEASIRINANVSDLKTFDFKNLRQEMKQVNPKSKKR